MGKPSKAILDFMAQYGVESDEIWEVHGTTWVVKHKALERVASELGITFDRPSVIACDIEKKSMIVCTFGKLGEKNEWSFGEATPANCKNSYFAAMAEKRSRDRVILKLLVTHGALYSESESDEFTQRPNPHVTRPADIVPETQYDEQGNPVNNIPRGDDQIERMPKGKAKADYALSQNELYATKTPNDLEAWGKKNANRIETYPADWQEILRGQYTTQMAELRAAQKEVA